MKISLGEMRLAIEQTHDCKATSCIESIKIMVAQCHKSVEVHLFEIERAPTADQCYAWGVEEGENKIAICAVLRSTEIPTAEQAVTSYCVR